MRRPGRGDGPLGIGCCAGHVPVVAEAGNVGRACGGGLRRADADSDTPLARASGAVAGRWCPRRDAQARELGACAGFPAHVAACRDWFFWWCRRVQRGEACPVHRGARGVRVRAQGCRGVRSVLMLEVELGLSQVAQQLLQRFLARTHNGQLVVICHDATLQHQIDRREEARCPYILPGGLSIVVVIAVLFAVVFVSVVHMIACHPFWFRRCGDRVAIKGREARAAPAMADAADPCARAVARVVVFRVARVVGSN